MRISDWSSDVCSSDLQVEIVDPRVGLAGPVLPTAVACDAQFHRLLQAEHPARQPAAGREHSGIEIEAVAVRLGVEDEGEPVVPVAQFCRKLDQRPSRANRSEEHTSELQSLMRISYAVFCLK